MNGEAAEAAWVDEADLAAVREREDGVGVRRNKHVWLRDEQAAGHAEVDKELGGLVFTAHRHDDGLADAADALDRGAGERLGDLGLGRLEGLGLAAGPDTRDALPGDAGVDTIGYGFNFRKFWHELLEIRWRLYRFDSMKIPVYARMMMAGAVIAAGAGAATVGDGHGPMLLVANQGDHTLSLIDPVAGNQITAVPVGGVTGHEVAVSPDGKLAYVPIYGNSGVGKPGTDGASMSVIDLAAHKVVRTVDFGHGVRPHLPVYDSATGKLYVTTELDKAITVIDPKSLNIEGQIPTGAEQSHMFVLSHDGKRAYTANVGPGSVSVLDLVGRKTVAVIPVSGKVQRISISRDGSMVFTADQVKPRMAVIDTASNRVKSWIELPAVGYGSAVTLDGRWLLVQMSTLKQVAVIDLTTMKVARTVPVDGGTGEILMNPNGRVAYVSCPEDGTVAEIDLGSWKVLKGIKAGHKADGMAWVK